jgi:hypothetical protein
MALPTTIPELSPVQYANRMAALFPPGWSSPEAKSPGGVLYAIMGMIGSGLSSENGAVRYAFAATRVQTAVGDALDLVAQDYLGNRLPRNPGENDTSYRARITAALLPQGATRAAVIKAVTDATGHTPRVIEPWRPSDTGAWGKFYWGVDNARTPFRWTNPALAYQGFIECTLPTPPLLGGNPVPSYDANFYWNVAGSSFIDPDPSVPLGPRVVYDAINLAKVYGTVVWVKFVPAPSLLNWDQPGVTWDQPGATWG